MNNAVTGFRGIVIFLIIFHHYSDRYSEIYQNSMSIEFSIVSQYGGMIGNIIFLVMTGFFMAKSLTKTDSGVKAMGQYAINRYWRFWPSYAMAVLFIVVILYFLPLPNRTSDLKTTLIDFIFIYHPGVQNIDGSHWFLALILIIQLLLSSVLLVKDIRIRKRLLTILLTLSVLLLIVGNVFNCLENYYYTALYLFSILTGIFLSLSNDKGKLVVLIFASIILLLFFKTPRVSIPTILLLVAFYLIINYPSYFNILEIQPIKFVGKISFSWYLVHQNIGFAIMYHFLPKGNVSILWILLPSVITLFIAYMIESVVQELPNKII